MLFVVSNSASNTSDCLRTFIQNQGVATQAQAKASTEDRQVIDDLINDFIHSRSRADAIKALNDYVAARAKNDKLRAAHPVPSSRGVCS
jgi:flagellar biosynthesis chaperone FliJ